MTGRATLSEPGLTNLFRKPSSSVPRLGDIWQLRRPKTDEDGNGQELAYDPNRDQLRVYVRRDVGGEYVENVE